MGKRWLVKNSSKKASFLRKEPIQDTSEANVLRLLRNGEKVYGDFLLVRRASREEGYVQVRHLERQCGSSWRVRNADGSGTTLLRKAPLDCSDSGNTVGYATEGELVVGEFMFVCHREEARGGHVKLRHLRAVVDDAVPAAVGTASAMDLATRLLGSPSASAQWSSPMQRWTVMDSAHDGAWLRKLPKAESDKSNIVCLLPNGELVVGDFVYVKRSSSGERGFVKFKDLQAEGRSWRVLSSEGTLTTVLRRKPLEAEGHENLAGHVVEGEHLEGEFVFVIRLDGRRSGYVKRRYLAALAPARGRFAAGRAEPLIVS